MPRTYLEIGVRGGHSLALSRCRSIGIDPDYEVVAPMNAPVLLQRVSSDGFFERIAARGARPFGQDPIDLAYVDGMHLFEYVLRDFVNVERYAAPTSVIGVDDIFPRNDREASRDDREWPWTGDVYKIVATLRRFRPDLTLILVDTEPTGTLLVAGCDPTSTVLGDVVEEIIRDTVTPDPQHVSADVISREGAMSADQALRLPLWDQLRAARDGTPTGPDPA